MILVCLDPLMSYGKSAIDELSIDEFPNQTPFVEYLPKHQMSYAITKDIWDCHGTSGPGRLGASEVSRRRIFR